MTRTDATNALNGTKSFSREKERKYIECDFDVFTVKQLQYACRSRNIHGISGKRKKQLQEIVEKVLINNNEALFDHRRNIVARPRKFMNTENLLEGKPISDRDPAFTFYIDSISSKLSPVRQVFAFDPCELVQMLLCTGKRVNPLNNDALSEEDISRLEIMYMGIIQAHPDSPSKRHIFRQRPDLNIQDLPTKPKKSSLGLSSNEDWPSPVKDFAPWKISENLSQRTTRALEEYMENKSHESIEENALESLTRTHASIFRYVNEMPEGSIQNNVHRGVIVNIYCYRFNYEAVDLFLVNPEKFKTCVTSLIADFDKYGKKYRYLKTMLKLTKSLLIDNLQHTLFIHGALDVTNIEVSDSLARRIAGAIEWVNSLEGSSRIVRDISNTRMTELSYVI